MTRAVLTLAPFLSAMLFPWPLTVLLALAASFFEPLVPLAVGLFADTLYFAPRSGALPLATLYGALATLLAFVVRARLKTGSMGE